VATGLKNPLLHRYWIEFERPPREAKGITLWAMWPPRACGITAYSVEDMLLILEEVSTKWRRTFPPIARITEDIDISTLPGIETMAIDPPIWRGMWYIGF
jgi:hypothetical protein